MTEEEKQEKRKEIVLGIKSHLDEVAKLSCEILKLEQAYGVSLSINITNLMGNCKTGLSIQTSGENSIGQMEEDIAGAVKSLESLGIPKEIVDIATAAFREANGLGPAPEKPAEEPVDPPSVVAEKLIAAMTEAAKQKRAGDPPAADQK